MKFKCKKLPEFGAMCKLVGGAFVVGEPSHQVRNLFTNLSLEITLDKLLLSV